ncbi:MAG: phosphatidylglycerophosphatase A [Chloroherpetonaceae bacterium]|nr:phosphatidylglycerophosphatase A [Chloroherpetonaceae bacterium]MDW8464861.1 phosphatidylglycerophosphatase A [Chloroherpetonaceae bacterium]
MKRFLALVFGTGFGTGYLRYATGTFGSLLALGLYWAVPQLSEPAWLGGAILVFFVIGLWSGEILEMEYGRDPREATIDEIVGQWIAVLFLPRTCLATALAFALFRLFDVIKPEPVHKLQRLPAGWGIMMDDVVAGIYANLLSHCLLWSIEKIF